MKRYLLKGVLIVLVMVGLVAASQPALAWVRVGIGLRVPFPVVVAPVVYAPLRPVHYRPVWIPGHYNGWGAWIPAHWR